KRLDEVKAVVELVAEGPRAEGVLKAVDVGKNTITLNVIVKKGEPGVDRSFAAAKDVQVSIDGAAGKLADLPVDARIAVQLSADQKTVLAVQTVSPRVFGILKGNALADSITLGNKQGEQSFQVAKQARAVSGEG